MLIFKIKRKEQLMAKKEEIMGNSGKSKQAEDALKSENICRAIAEAAQDAIFIINREDKIEYVNSFGARLFELQPEKVVGRKRETLFSADISALQEDKLNKVFETGRPLVAEERIVFPKGEIWMHTSLVPMWNEAGEVNAVMGISRDISERKRAEDALLESEKRFQVLAEATFEGIAIHEKGVIVNANQIFANMFGYKQSEVIGKSALELAAPESRALVQQNILSGYEQPYEAVGLKKDGARFIGELHGKTISHLGRSARITAIRDITDRKRAEEEMRLLCILTKAISESEDFHVAMNIVIRKFCEVTGWVYGEAWVPAHDESYFEMDSAWYSSIKGMEEFRKKSVGLKFSMDKGIPGRVWASKKPLWVRDISKDTNFARTQLAEQFGLRSGIGIPIIVGDDVVAVLTFFVFEDRKENDALLTLISAIAAQLGTLFQRKLAEEALAESESRLRAIIEMEPECIKMLAADGSLLNMNPAGLAMIEADSLDQAKSVSVYSLIDPEHREKYKQMNADIFRGKSGTLEFKMTALKGSSRWIESHGTPFRNANNEIVAQLAIARDITDRKRMEEELLLLYTLIQETSLSEDFRSAIEITLRRICETTGWVMGEAWVPSSDRSHLECSPAWYGGFEGLKKFRKISEGFSFQPGVGLPGRSWSSKKPAWDRDVTLDSNFPRAPYAREAGLKGAMAIPILAGDEVVAVMDFFVLEPREEDRRLVGLVSTIAAYMGTIFQRKQVEEELRKLYHAVEQSPASIFIMDAAFNIEYINPKFIEITGYSREEVIGKKPDIISSGTAMISDTEWRGEFLAKKKNGDPFWEYATISPIRNAQGVIINFIGIHEDVTERRKLEDQLRHSQKLEALGQLVGGIAHDFNNMLTAIIGFAGILQMKMKKDDPLMVNVEQVIEAANRGASLTSSLLVFGRKQAIFPRPVNLNEIIDKVEKLLLRLIGEDIELKTVIADKELNVTVDPLQIEQVLINLATNARDAMSKEGVLTIETGREEIDRKFIKSHGYGEPGEYALISISDTGAGMDEKTREKVFEPFFTTKEVGKGTGLGLAIVYGIVKQHNGYITVYSEVGKGTTFKIYLPMTRPGTEEAAPVENVNSAASAVSATGTETVLVAEDDKNVMRLSKTLLETFGYTVIEAVNGEEAVQKYMENKDMIKLLIFDVIMPKRNGKEAYEEIKRIAPDVRVIFMSGYTADIMHTKGIIENGMVFVSKPISPTDFIKKVREVLDR